MAVDGTTDRPIRIPIARFAFDPIDGKTDHSNQVAGTTRTQGTKDMNAPAHQIGADSKFIQCAHGHTRKTLGMGQATIDLDHPLLMPRLISEQCLFVSTKRAYDRIWLGTIEADVNLPIASGAREPYDGPRLDLFAAKAIDGISHGPHLPS